jgi:hypothetical protein
MGEREANLALIGYGGAAVVLCAGAFAVGMLLVLLIWGAW